MTLRALIMPRTPRPVVRWLAVALKAAMLFGVPRDTLLWAELDRWLEAEKHGEGRG